MNYWHDDDQEVWFDSISSGELTDNIHDHLDTKDFNEKPTNDINNQIDTKESSKDKENELQRTIKR